MFLEINNTHVLTTLVSMKTKLVDYTSQASWIKVSRKETVSMATKKMNIAQSDKRVPEHISAYLETSLN